MNRENKNVNVTNQETALPTVSPAGSAQTQETLSMSNLQDNSTTQQPNVATQLEPEPVKAATAPNPFDPAALRLSQDFGASLGVKKVITNIPCRKPNRQEFVRVRPGVEWQLDTGVFEDKISRDVYLVQRPLLGEPTLAGEVSPVHLVLAVNRQGDPFMWAVKLPSLDGKSNSWNDSALAACKLSETKWIRVAANMTGGMYDVFEAASELSEPVWPDLSLPEILKLCFKDRFIQSLDHPVIRALRGLN